ncbi:MAG TPA: glycoside hydrolase family 3 N-terminal domain-containing protein [Saprospiraceae bacterium]|nr:glycoside hydrolase family 3 N-terminal domain-containing protein [Saprospiraceae bacterium]
MQLLCTILMGILITIFSSDESSENRNTTQSHIALARTDIKVHPGGIVYRDLNKNGRLDPYEDIRQDIETRVKDVLSQMTLEEKAGMLFINGAPVNDDGSLEKKMGTGFSAFLPAAIENMDKLKMTHFNLWQIPADPSATARWYNNLQRYAEQNTRLGIPVTIASDPRHHFSNSIFSMNAQGFSQFCETLGFAALGDVNLVREFADIVRAEYLAVGIREALHPQIDLGTEPRWPRINGGFGEDAQLTSKMVKAYIFGMQGPKLGAESIACMTKHFPGGGPQNEGLDPHFEFQKGQIYPGENFNYHLIPFEAAIASGTAAIMPYYGIPVGQTEEDVAMAYNTDIITGLLREKYNYDGVVCTDWGLVSDVPMGADYVYPARAWGAEHLSEADRVLKILNAGCDQFGGENKPELVVELVKAGKLKETRVDISVKRLLKQKFQLGLFDNPYLDESKVKSVVGNASSRQLGEVSQQRSMTLLKNDNHVLPLAKRKLKVYIEKMDSATVSAYATVVKTPQEADLAIIRLQTPWYPVDSKNSFAVGFHHGDLDFKGEEKERILNLLKTVPTIIDIYLDRPAVIPEIAAQAKALIADYGASDKSVCEVLFGNAKPEGKLPFELPSSMDAVRNQKADVPYDSEKPLYEFGYGLRYR